MKNTLKSAFVVLQKIGKALMLPVSVLPIAGILLGIGSAHFSFIPDAVSNVMLGAGDAIFGNLALLFAVSVTLGLTNNDGVAGFSSIVSYAVLLATMGVMATVMGVPTKPTMGIETINVGVAGGILIGSITASLYNKYFNIELPPYLGFFGGKRFIPIVSSLAAIIFGVILSFVWPPIGNSIQAFSVWASHENPALAFALYGIGERSLIPFGLHHILNAPFFFETGSFIDPATGKTITGEIQRYIYGDPTAGNLTGGYLFKMWGLPGAALAMWYMAKPENKKRVGGIMIAASLTSFLTGITEPIEFSFLFLAPLLYVAHALMAGLAYFLCIILDIKHSMTFSHGLIDFILLYPKSTNAGYLWLLGPLWGVLYFSVFCFIIKKFNLKTPGREDELVQNFQSSNSSDSNAFAEKLVNALGGAKNIKTLDSCITRLRVQLESTTNLQPEVFKQLGATNSVVVGNGVQVIFGPRSENIKNQLDQYLQMPTDQRTSTVIEEKTVQIRSQKYLQLLGNQENIVDANLLSGTRIRIQLKSLNSVKFDELKNDLLKIGILTEKYNSNTIHIIAGLNKEMLKQITNS